MAASKWLTLSCQLDALSNVAYAFHVAEQVGAEIHFRDLKGVLSGRVIYKGEQHPFADSFELFCAMSVLEDLHKKKRRRVRTKEEK